MKRLVIREIAKLCAEALLIAMVIGVVVVIIGYINQWDTSIAYSNAFFIAGCLLIVAGGSTRLAASQEWNTYQRLPAESFRDLSPTEQANFIVNASSSLRLVILGVLGGIFLCIIAALCL